MSKMQLQFKIYMGSLRQPLKIILLVYLANIIIGTTINITVLNNRDVFSTNVHSASILLLYFLLGLMVAVPIVNYNMLPLFMGFGMTRRSYYRNMGAFNALVCLIGAFAMTAVYFSQNLLLGSNTNVLFLMGFASIDYSFHTFFLYWFLCLGVFLALVSLVSLVCAVFHSEGVLFGISSILLIASIPMFFIREIADYVVWGGPSAAVGVGLIICAAAANLAAEKFVSGYEVRN